MINPNIASSIEQHDKSGLQTIKYGKVISSSSDTNSFLKNSPSVTQLEVLFNRLFKASENTILVSGAEEPLYQPAGNKCAHHQIISTQDYFSSALHEISHWCIAGKARRQLVDYGYWYEPDGRSVQQQSLFEKVEVKPQALEWLFTYACRQPFRLSIDNVNQPELSASDQFKYAVWAQVQDYLKDGLPVRAQLFVDTLLEFYSSASEQSEPQRLVGSNFKLEDLR